MGHVQGTIARVKTKKIDRITHFTETGKEKLKKYENVPIKMSPKVKNLLT